MPQSTDLKKLGLWNQEMMQQVKYFDGELKDIPEIGRASCRERVCQYV